MKKLLLIVFTIFTLIPALPQQRSFDKGDNLINVGAGLGRVYGFRYNLLLPSVTFTGNFELGIHEFIGVGPFVAFSSNRYDFGPERYTYTETAFGARVTVHFTDLLNEGIEAGIPENMDFYVTASVGVLIANDEDPDIDPDLDFPLGPIVGFRYYFSDDLALYVEGGWGSINYGTLGLTLRL